MGIGVNHLTSFEEAITPVQQQPVQTPEQPAQPKPVAEPVAAQPETPKPIEQGVPDNGSPEPVTPPTEPEPSVEVNQEPNPATEEPAPQDTPPVEQPKTLELTDDAIIEHLKKTRKAELSSLDDLFKKPEPQADPLEGLSEEALKFIKYNKETGRGFSDFQELNRDYSKASPLELARENAIKMANGSLNQSNVDKYLEKKLNIDLSDPANLEQFDVAELESFANPYRLQKIEEQKKYNQPIERPKQEASQSQEDLVTLENGVRMPKAQYEQLKNQRAAYEESVRKAKDSITNSAYQVKFDDNGTEKIIDVAYDFSKEDLHHMESNALDIDKAVLNMFGTENGLDQVALQEGLFWADRNKREKAINSLVHKALAQQAKEFMKLQGNTNFSSKKIDSKETNGKPLVIPGAQSSGYGVKYDFSNL